MQKSTYHALLSITLLLFLASILTSCGNEETASNDAPADNESTMVETSQVEEPTNDNDRARIVFFGNSLTAGYGLDEQYSFPSRVQEKIDSAGYQYQVVNAGLSGETTAGGLNRIDWVMEQPIEVFVLELGGNDVLRGFDLSATLENLRKILDAVQEKYPEAKLVVAGMEAPPNMGQQYTDEFRKIFRQLAEAYDAALIPFLLDGVGGIPELNLPDRIHPNQDGQVIVAQNVWEVIEPLLEKES